MMDDQNKKCVAGHFEVLWNRGLTDRIDEFFSSDFVNFGVHYSEARAVIQQIISIWRTAFPDLHFQIGTLIADGDTVMCEVTFSGTHLGEFRLLPPYRGLTGPTLSPNGRSFSVSHIHRFRLRDARIVEHFAVRDDLGMFLQLGHLASLAS
jgi:predicted ester cyclase